MFFCWAKYGLYLFLFQLYALDSLNALSDETQIHILQIKDARHRMLQEEALQKSQLERREAPEL